MIFIYFKFRTKIWKVNLTVPKKTETLLKCDASIFNPGKRYFVESSEHTLQLSKHFRTEISRKQWSCKTFAYSDVLHSLAQNSFWLGSSVNAKGCSQPPVQLQSSERTLELSQNTWKNIVMYLRNSSTNIVFFLLALRKLNTRKTDPAVSCFRNVFASEKMFLATFIRKRAVLFTRVFVTILVLLLSELFLLYDRVNVETPK